ncbi:MAG: 23S rRNA (uracil(1939)-C(5))-methyltransferase RlmD [Roseburia sp.]|nr:23S rRNA (uracil(1939)-C(5))-methyltransferase RlmD [Anaeroplasma bactoclasticum]MCM1197213.1 23S rRNA (uracil(1939)-C(5))-methyltransferase RlmD [Roseburia sp.]MCM1557769.1 23S rRNA (uracil(1939)-C(5))-methyltransferase RlmD [Anaeroplasma bactoclasticum]
MLKEFQNVKVNYEADALVEIRDKTYKIHDCIEGEDILVETEGKYPTLSKVLKPSVHRIKDGCPYQKECGGCQFMHMEYSYEVEQKKKFLQDLFQGIKGIPGIEVFSTFEPTYYRNKSQMTYKLSKTKKVVCGFYEEYSHRLITVEDCMLQSKASNKVIQELNKILSKHKIKPYDEATRTGVLRHVLVRYGFQTKELMLVLVTNGEMFPGRSNVVKDLLKLNLNITTIVQNYNARDTSIVLGDKNKVLYGTGFIYELVGDYKFKISPNSFFQVNSLGMKKLYSLAINSAQIKNTDIVVDAYCGVGTISIFASKYAKEVIGVELNKQAVQDANMNARINKIQNVSFICDDATNYITNAAKNRTKLDCLIMDPPREGSTPQFINAISYLKPRTVIYISCNPLTLKRDLSLFKDSYQIITIAGYDNFPRTKHIEVITLLELRK